LDDAVAVDPTPVHRVGDLVENDEAMLAGYDRGGCELPGRRGTALALVEVRRLPGESVASLEPVDSELPPNLLLADLPLIGLDELDHADPPAARETAHHHSK